MIDELDLAFEDRADKGRHRRGARRAKSRGGGTGGGGRGKTAAALLVTLLLLGALGGGGWYAFDRVQTFFATPDFDGGGTGEVVVQVHPGDSATDIGNTLAEAGVVKSTKAFTEEARANSRSQNIQPGFYRLRLEMSAATALGLLLDLENKVSNRVTIPEGRTAIQLYQALAEATDIPAEEFAAAAKDPLALGVPDWWLTRTDGQQVTPSAEGFLFPDTYDFDPDLTAPEILRLMVDRFLTVTGELEFADRVQAERGGISPYEALIVASLAQAEAGNAEDLAKVARVAYNRVYSETFPCSCLQFDVTVNYYWELTGKPTKASKDMTREELYDESNPYSTHARGGLPPTPINNPGKAALEGALNPPDEDWLYFVAIDKEGHSAFAVTLAEHEANIEIARQNGIL
ncbi:endolytic transglycosylase MltG [Solwaraspora sp. WMMD406]|uniref:endolytic transglycosylase MltG n=1 Tax=Solwaraspora sp. WMMD406 TaxID=3016095 RepID=UPI002417B092|nr:endolytic transglycosylase MltG [Solwaraspora sp. WMMD406]MDG4766504.1 endolytic transglycosylase MltG [Solwaraspora sp. WMMD406]